MASYTGQPSIFGFAAPLGLLFNKVTVIRSRDTHSPKQLALSQEVPQCQEHKSPGPRRALHSCSTWGPLTALAALRNGDAGAAPLQCLSAATSALFAPSLFGAISHFVSVPDAIMMADPLEKP